jgi:hypothetical protein
VQYGVGETNAPLTRGTPGGASRNRPRRWPTREVCVEQQVLASLRRYVLAVNGVQPAGEDAGGVGTERGVHRVRAGCPGLSTQWARWRSRVRAGPPAPLPSASMTARRPTVFRLSVHLVTIRPVRSAPWPGRLPVGPVVVRVVWCTGAAMRTAGRGLRGHVLGAVALDTAAAHRGDTTRPVPLAPVATRWPHSVGPSARVVLVGSGGLGGRLYSEGDRQGWACF